MNRALRLAAGFVVALVLGVVLLAVASIMTWPSVNANVAESADALSVDAERFPWFSMPMVLDDFSDAIKLNIIHHDGSDTLVRDAMVGAYYSVHPAGELVPTESLRVRVEAGEQANTRYSNYWHGYLPFKRLAFSVANLQQLRVVNSVLMALLLAAALRMVARRVGVDVAIGLAVTLALVAPHLIPLSLHYSPAFYLVLIGLCAALYLGDRRALKRYDLELFGTIGIATAFFDLLTAPALTLVVPLLVVLGREVRSGTRAKADPCSGNQCRAPSLALSAVRACVAWAVGYVGFWVSKWILNDALFGFSDVSELAQHTLQRAGAGMTLADRWATVLNNIFHVVPSPLWPADATVASATMVAVGSALLIVVLWGVLAMARRADIRAASRAWPIPLVGLLPIAWLLFAAEHSFVHAFFTFRVLWATLFAVWVWFCLTVRKTEVTYETLD